MKLTKPILTDLISIFKERHFGTDFKNYGRTPDMDFLHISDYMRIQTTCSSIILILTHDLKRVQSHLNTEVWRDRNAREQALRENIEIQPSFQYWARLYILVSLGIRLSLVRLDRLRRKYIILYNLRFLTSDKLNRVWKKRFDTS